MRCPRCFSINSTIVSGEPDYEKGMKRTRSCNECAKKWQTIEIPLSEYKKELQRVILKYIREI